MVPALRPFVPPLEQALVTAAAQVVGAPVSEVVRAVVDGPRRPGDPRFLVQLDWSRPDGVVGLDVFDAEGARQAWFRAGPLAFSYRTVDGDPFSRPGSRTFLEGLRQSLGTGTGEAARGLVDAAERWRAFAGLRDEAFRTVVETVAGPTGVLWLGFGCNQDCVHCWQDRRAGGPPIEVFEGWIDSLVAGGVRAITLSGGEPTLLPELPALVRRASAAGASVQLETNGIRLAEPGVLDTLVAAGVQGISVSLHSHESATNDAITRAPGTFEKTVQGLKAALGAGLPVFVHVLVDRRNARALGSHARFVAGFQGVRRVSYSTPIRAFDARAQAPFLAGMEDVRAGLAEAVPVLAAAGIDAEFLGAAGFPLCVAPPDRVREAMARQPVVDRADRVLVDRCATCAASKACHGLPTVTVQVHGGLGLRPLDERGEERR